MQRIYEEKIDKKSNDLEHYESNVISLLEKESIPFEKKICSKINYAANDYYYYEEMYEKYMVIFVSEEFVEKAKKIIGEELCVPEVSLSKNELDEINNFDSEEITENEIVEIDFEKYKKIHNEMREDFNKIKKNKKILLILYIVSGILFALVGFGYLFSKALTKMGENKLNIEWGGELITISIVLIMAVTFCNWIINSKYKKKEQKVVDDVIIPSVKILLAPCKFSIAGIKKEFFENASISKIFYFNKFDSKDKIVGTIDDKRVIVSKVILKCKEPQGVYYPSFDGVFLKQQIEKFTNKKIWVRITCNEDIYSDNKDNYGKDFDVFEDDYLVDKDILNSDFENKILELRNKYRKNVNFYFMGNVSYIMIDNIDVLAKTDKLFSDDLTKESVLENINIIKEYIEAANMF